MLPKAVTSPRLKEEKKMTKVTAEEAKKICERLGLSYDDGQRTFWAYDEESDELYDFDTKAERESYLMNK